MINLMLAIVCAYLVGSIPPGLFWAWVFKKIDVRRYGSGRTGGTNVWRTAGFWAAFITALCDAFKAAVAVWIARAFSLDEWGQALAGTAVVVGHNYSIYLKFRGGAGTMPSVGAAAALWGWMFPILVGSGIVAGWLVGHASVASIVVALLLPLVFGLRGDIPAAVAYGLPTMILTLWALRPNLVRLWHREERFIPIFTEKPPLILLSNHPQAKK